MKSSPYASVFLILSVALTLSSAALHAGSMDQPYGATIQISNILREYAANEFAADEKYKDKAITLTGGVVDRIAKEEGDIPVVWMRVSGVSDLYYVRCYFADTSGLANVRVGRPLVIRGIVDGKHNTALVVKRCSLPH